MAKDIVCGMEVMDGSICTEYEDKLYCFCAEACKEEFLRDPSKYLDEYDTDKGH